MKNIRVFYLKIFQFLELKFSIYLNRRVFVMCVCLSLWCRWLDVDLTVSVPEFTYLLYRILPVDSNPPICGWFVLLTNCV